MKEKKENPDSRTEYQPLQLLFGTPVTIDTSLDRHAIKLIEPNGQGVTLYMEPNKGFVSYFEMAAQNIIDMHRKKAADYTDGGEFDNFIESAQAAGIETYQAIENLIGTKEARIRTLRRREVKGHDGPVNEPLLDSYLDRAVYSLIQYAYQLMVSEDTIPPTRSNFTPPYTK